MHSRSGRVRNWPAIARGRLAAVSLTTRVRASLGVSMRWLSLWCLLCVVACDQRSADRCVGLADGPVQLVETDNPRFHVDFAGGYTYISSEGIWSNDLDHALYVGEGCGARARALGRGLSMRPLRLHPDDRDADDASLMCDVSGFGEIFRIDLDGEAPPQLLLPRLSCHGMVATPHGPVFGERHTLKLWHIPSFPAEADEVAISLEAYRSSLAWLGDRLLYAARDGIHRRDLVGGEDELLVPGAVGFVHTETHLLWQGPMDGDIAPIRLRDLASGEDHDVGLFDLNVDFPGPYERSWRFDADGAHVLHLPKASDSLMSAYDLSGAEVPFAGTGERLAYPPSGGVIVRDGAIVRHAFAGSATGTTLDVPEGAILDDLQAIDDHLELRVGDDLYAVPLDGGPPALLAHDVGAVRVRVDARLLLSVAADGELALIHVPTGERRAIASAVKEVSYHAGHGAYFSRLGALAAADEGVWMVADEWLDAQFPACGGSCP